ncbi:MAG TPA: chemotaxis protein CheB, partial [Gemmatimonadaceae bacterium]|nr:chemotaxis protein CheB [Gemmatimonadaceae bacterium]
MGRDGAEGARRIRRGGGTVLVQEPSEAVVSGMPAAALRQAGADAILSLDDAADRIARAVERLPSASAVPDGCP